ncbi:hypothetical protein HYV57_05210 [Candidatus Peregrinibacteria bacterium]|nr:hypothetical protein [Candidatus Peregrinibacteria bacterium]
MTIFIVKFIVAVAVVIGLSIIAEKSSPRIAGILSGYPTGSAISLFFFGLEINPEFAAKSAVYNMIAIVAMQAFIYFYYKASLKFNMVISSLVAIVGYFVIIWLLHFIELNTFVAILIPITSIFLFFYLFRPIKNVQIENKVQLNLKVFFIRALFAASIILFITEIAKLVGPTWSGLFSAFPTTLFPLILIVHFTYDKKHVHTIIKNIPIGIFSLVLYSLTVSIVYPFYGIYWGTLMSFGVATVYLVAYQLFKKLRMFFKTKREFLKELDEAEKDWEKHGGKSLSQMKKKYKL